MAEESWARLKVLIVVKDVSTGTWRYTTELMEYFGSRGHACFLSSLGADPPKEIRAGRSYEFLVKTHTDWLTRNLLGWLVHGVGLRRLVSEGGIDLVIAQNLDDSAATALFAGVGLRPVVFFVHDLTDRELYYFRPELPRPLLNLVWGVTRLRQEVLLRLNHNIIVASRFMRDSLAERGATGIVIIPHGANPMGQTHDYDERKPGLSIIAVGNMNLKKRFDTVFLALALLKDIDVRLTLVGSGRLEAKLRKMAAEIGIASMVTFAGVLDDSTLFDSIAKSDLAVIASQWEGFGLVALDAMASGVPVLASDGGALPELVTNGKNGYLFRVGDYRQLSELIRHLYFHRAELRSLGEGAISSAQALSWGRTFEMTESYLANCLARGGTLDKRAPRR